MKDEKLFKETVQILVDAYRNDTLQHGSPCGCAVGNIIANRLGYEYETNERGKRMWKQSWAKWVDAVVTVNGKQNIYEYKMEEKEVAKEINSTGYSYKNVYKIEYAFEAAPKGSSDDDWMLNGLLAVYDVLCDIHEVNKEEIQKGELVFIK